MLCAHPEYWWECCGNDGLHGSIGRPRHQQRLGRGGLVVWSLLRGIECSVCVRPHPRVGHREVGHAQALPALSGPPTPLCLADPANIEGNAETAQVLGLTPWMDYEFRVIASNILGTGEPSGPSSKIRTKEAGQPRVCRREVASGIDTTLLQGSASPVEQASRDNAGRGQATALHTALCTTTATAWPRPSLKHGPPDSSV